MRFTFEVEGKREFDRAFNRVGEHVQDLRPVWPHVTREFFETMDEQFKSEGSKGRSGKWKELEPAYAKQKAIDYPGQPILQRTGKLFASLTGKTSDTVLIEEKDEFGFGSSLLYAKFHQTGTSKMPAREIFSFTELTRTRITKAMQKGLLTLIKGDRDVTKSLEVDE